MIQNNFKPEHINATAKELEGNNGLGRYVFFPGSFGRAKLIAESCFLDLRANVHHRGHTLYMGRLNNIEGQNIDVAAVASGMGTPSVEIILNELINLGTKRFLRVGTSGLLQPQFMKPGDFVIATGAVRDENATRNYIPSEYPAIASMDMIIAAQKASEKQGFKSKTYSGLIHSKDTLFAREFLEGPNSQANRKYMGLLRRSGVLASDMEASMLFVLSSLFEHKFNQRKFPHNECNKIKSGAVCVVLGEGTDFGSEQSLERMTTELIQFAKYTIIELARLESDLISREIKFNK
jgi:uridine phosphorylase